MERLRCEVDALIPVFVGFDAREEVGYHTFCSSIIRYASQPVAIVPLDLKLLAGIYGGGARDGTNAFIYSRFLVPHLMGRQGWAIFADGCDMIVRGDIAQLWAMRDDTKALLRVPHDYKTRNPRKYIGTSMEAANRDYFRKNQSSLMLMNCAHDAWAAITPEFVARADGAFLHGFEFIEDRCLGELPCEWNWLCDEYGENTAAKVLHWTAGIPAFEHYRFAPNAEDWFAANHWVTHAAD